MCCPLVFEFSVGIGGFVIGLGQISFFFNLLGAMKISDILARRTRVKDKNNRSSVSQSMSYNVLCA